MKFTILPVINEKPQRCDNMVEAPGPYDHDRSFRQCDARSKELNWLEWVEGDESKGLIVCDRCLNQVRNLVNDIKKSKQLEESNATQTSNIGPNTSVRL